MVDGLHETDTLYDREGAAAFLGVTPHAIDYYVGKMELERRLRPDYSVKDGRTYKNMYRESTLRAFQASLRGRGRSKVQKP